MLDIPPDPVEEARQLKSVLAILADAGVILLPDGSSEPGYSPPQEVY